MGILQDIISGFLVFGFGIPAHFPQETVDQYAKYGHKIEIVKEIPKAPKAAGYYDGEEDRIYLDLDYIKGNRRATDIYATHEVIHRIRVKASLWTFDQSIEEAVAVYATEMAVKLYLGRRVRINERIMLRRTLKVNGAPPLTDLQKKIVDVEIQKTLELIKREIEVRKVSAKGPQSPYNIKLGG